MIISENSNLASCQLALTVSRMRLKDVSLTTMGIQRQILSVRLAECKCGTKLEGQARKATTLRLCGLRDFFSRSSQLTCDFFLLPHG